MSIVKRIITKIPKIPRRIRKLYYIKWNRILFQANNIEFGKNIQITNHLYIEIHPSAHIKIGDNFTFTSGEALNPISRNIKGSIHATQNARITIGNNVGISSACLWAKEYIQIGNNVKIGSDCIIMDTDAHNLDYHIRASIERNDEGALIDSATAKSKPIIIEDDVLIGTRCIILKGVTIGKHSIIGGGSIVTKSIPANCIAAGNPCKIIRNIP